MDMSIRKGIPNVRFFSVIFVLFLFYHGLKPCSLNYNFLVYLLWRESKKSDLVVITMMFEDYFLFVKLNTFAFLSLEIMSNAMSKDNIIQAI